MFLEVPHLRFDGVYVSRNSYIRTGVPELSRHRIVSLAVYYRYYRFFPDGTMLYRTSPATISKVSPCVVPRDFKFAYRCFVCIISYEERSSFIFYLLKKILSRTHSVI